ncbi:hypothetical protein [Lysinibacillus varians]|uniref:hypothetical protein n=1 Tax=Lysinibacillus varians TaxID=1145276 RepID=UPI00042F0500|nr:hypothetical protein [Lysinibacillus varians]AHN24494.1 hypothetical protein T479_20140 [Lysinibacillus varians]
MEELRKAEKMMSIVNKLHLLDEEELLYLSGAVSALTFAQSQKKLKKESKEKFQKDVS